MGFCSLDFCSLCGKYDTIQCYVQVGCQIRHVCEDCYEHFFKSASVIPGTTPDNKNKQHIAKKGRKGQSYVNN